VTISQLLTEAEWSVAGTIDITFDFRSDTPPGKDPDSHSPTLRRYHKRLWSKPLPNGLQFDLLDTTPHVYLHYPSMIGEFWLSSDAVVPTFTRRIELRQVLEMNTSGTRATPRRSLKRETAESLCKATLSAQASEPDTWAFTLHTSL
jgi:hypothetical protein